MLARLRSRPVVVVEAGGGYGKSVLVEEAAQVPGAVVLRGGTVGDARERFVARLVQGLERAGLGGLAAALTSAGDDPSAAVERLVEALWGQTDPVTILVDEVEEIGVLVLELLAPLVRDVAAPHHVVLVGRHVPAMLTVMARGERVARVGDHDLAFSDEDVARLLAEGFGINAGEDEVAELRRATDGWPAAVVEAATEVATSPAPASTAGTTGTPRAAAGGGPSGAPGAVARLVADPARLVGPALAWLAALDEADRAALEELAHLPLLADEVIAAVGGASAETLERAVRAGVPLRRVDGRWRVLVRPVREALARGSRLKAATARRAAGVYLRSDELAAAIDVLFRAGLGGEVAAMLADLPEPATDRLPVEEIDRLVSRLDEAALTAHPRVLVLLARMYETNHHFTRWEAAIEAAGDVHGDDPRLERALRAHEARANAVRGRAREASRVAEEVLSAADADELRTRARALEACARARADSRTVDALSDARVLLQGAAELWGLAEEPIWRAQTMLLRARSVELPLGQGERALELVEEAIGLLPSRGWMRGLALTYRAEIRTELLHLDLAAADVAEAAEVGSRPADRQVVAHAHWVRARIASYAEDAASTRAEIWAVERDADEWFDSQTGLEFLADAAVLLDRTGQTVLAREYLDRAIARDAGGSPAVRIASFALDARSGDPRRAEATLEELGEVGALAPQLRWRVRLLAALAARRGGDERRAGVVAARAFDDAAALGEPDLPLRTERAVAEELRAAAVDAGVGGAVGLLGDEHVTITLLGSFRILRGGVDVTPQGAPAEVLKQVAANGGTIHVDELVEKIWPGAGPSVGRTRLRNVLVRLRRSCQDVVLRDGDVLRLAEGTTVDAGAFEADASAAFALVRSEPDRAVDLAWQAFGAYGGELLPHDRYASWAAGPRERLRRRYLAVLDLLAAHAEERDDLEGALHLVELAIDEDGYDEGRYVRAAVLLARQDRRSRALAMLRKAREVLADLGLEPSASHRELERRIRGG